MCIAELMRVLRTGGRALLTVWAFEQHRTRCTNTGETLSDKSMYLQWGENKINGLAQQCTDHERKPHNSSLPVHMNNTPFTQQDVLVPFKTPNDGGRTQLRFYHVFIEGELERLVAGIAQCRLLRCFYEQGNWCAELLKL